MDEALAGVWMAIDEHSGLSPAACAAVGMLCDRVTVEHAIDALEALRPTHPLWFEKLADALAHSHRDVVLAIALPGAQFDPNLDVRTARAAQPEENWHGDLLIELATDRPG